MKRFLTTLLILFMTAVAGWQTGSWAYSSTEPHLGSFLAFICALTGGFVSGIVVFVVTIDVCDKELNG